MELGLELWGNIKYYYKRGIPLLLSCLLSCFLFVILFRLLLGACYRACAQFVCIVMESYAVVIFSFVFGIPFASVRSLYHLSHYLPISISSLVI